HFTKYCNPDARGARPDLVRLPTPLDAPVQAVDQLRLGCCNSVSTSAAAPTLTIKLTKLTPAIRQWCMETGACLYCRKPGHSANACPTSPARPTLAVIDTSPDLKETS
ncbi:MAG: hypothetical protein BJ554DRAFT_7001, partial [Olpidium bornovanus]